jgi:hypothetical protein
LRSCRAGAISDYYLSLGKCDNLSDPAAQAACQKQASADRTDALATCDARYDARQMVCGHLGGTPYDPVINPSNFVRRIDNPYFPLKPGTTFIYEGQSPEGLEHVEVFVTRRTKVILGVTCVEVRDKVKLDGELIEDTIDWYAQDAAGNVWYMGENSKQIADGLVMGLEGSWIAGVDGAKPGLIMEAHPAVGDFYRQEFLLGVAEDVAQVLSLTQSVAVPAGSFNHCLQTRDTTPLETDLLEQKFYAPNVGFVLEKDLNTGERLELVQITTQ